MPLGKGTIDLRCFSSASVVWQDIHAIHECRTGLQPVRCSAIKKRDGELCVGPEETLCRWREHLKGVLNVISLISPLSRQHLMI